jgi:hypothetical protein
MENNDYWEKIMRDEQGSPLFCKHPNIKARDHPNRPPKKD